MKCFMCLIILSTLFLTTPVLAETKLADPAVQSLGVKLDKVLTGQQEILRQLDEIKKELAIVKARATR